MFSEFGTVSYCRVVVDPDTEHSRGRYRSTEGDSKYICTQVSKYTCTSTGDITIECYLIGLGQSKIIKL